MNMNTLVITNIYNEEYLLPFWLKHHVKIFDLGLIIDYNSNDTSIEICKNICPHWKIIKSRNSKFQAQDVDNELMDYEKKFNCIKIILNTTEFLFIDKPIKYYFNTYNKSDLIFAINNYTPFSKIEFNPETLEELYNNFTNNNVRFIKNCRPGNGFRFIHSYSYGNYNLGRHSTNHKNVILTNNFFIIWLGFFPWNDRFLKRKLQIKNNIPNSDKEKNYGYQHFYDEKILLNIRNKGWQDGNLLKNINTKLFNIILNL